MIIEDVEFGPMPLILFTCSLLLHLMRGILTEHSNIRRMHFEGTLRKGLHLAPALAPTRLNIPRGDGARRLGHLGFRVRRLCRSVLPRSELLVQLVGFSSRYTLGSSSNIHHPVAIPTHRQASRLTVHSRRLETLSGTHPTQYVRVPPRSQDVGLTRV